ncbi:MAG: hypothetical protein V4672_22975 [Verrucomicrobiota bacterium]
MNSRNLQPSEFDLLRDYLPSSEGKLHIHFSSVNARLPFTDYSADIMRLGSGLYRYTLGGHGIGTNQFQPMALEDIIPRLLEDNKRFNRGGSLTLEWV